MRSVIFDSPDERLRRNSPTVTVAVTDNRMMEKRFSLIGRSLFILVASTGKDGAATRMSARAFHKSLGKTATPSLAVHRDQAPPASPLDREPGGCARTRFECRCG